MSHRSHACYMLCPSTKFNVLKKSQICLRKQLTIFEDNVLLNKKDCEVIWPKALKVDVFTMLRQKEHPSVPPFVHILDSCLKQGPQIHWICPTSSFTYNMSAQQWIQGCHTSLETHSWRRINTRAYFYKLNSSGLCLASAVGRNREISSGRVVPDRRDTSATPAVSLV
jgi:hypothetical protein